MTKRYLFVLITVALALAGLYYRAQNAKTAHTKVQQIIQQDATAASSPAASIASLKAFVKAHMGTSVKFTLSGAYTRAQAAAKAAATAQDPNSQIYADAQRACSGKSDSITQARCNQDYLSKHLVSVQPAAPVPQPNPADYQYNLTSPPWTPDMAGALLLGAAVAGVMALADLLSAKGRRQ